MAERRRDGYFSSIRKIVKIVFFELAIGGLWGNISKSTSGRWKALLLITELHRWLYPRCLWQYNRNDVEVGAFRRGWITLQRNVWLELHFPPTFLQH